MPVLVLVTLIALITENSGQPIQYMVSCSPNWNHIYTGDAVSLRCDIGPNENIKNFYWYKDNKKIQQLKQEFTIIWARNDDAGEYECWTGSGYRSHPLRLYVMDKDLQNRRPTVIFSPNYRNIFAGEEMEISCVDGSGEAQSQKYEWYKDKKKLMYDEKSIKILVANKQHSGNYKCTKWSRASYPVRLEVYPKDDKIILQTPPNIVEGDRLFMRCHISRHYNDKGLATFYKDGVVIQKKGQILQVLNVNKSMTGTYRCEKALENGKLLKAKERFLFIQDFVVSPTVNVSSSINDDEMTLTCDTRRNPLREDTELHFTFYRNGQKVEEAGSSDTYTVRAAQLEDSGNYTCEARTPSHTVRKMSDATYINITELFEKPKLQIRPERVQEGNQVTIMCLYSKRLPNSSYTFYRDSQTVQRESYKNEYVIPHASEEDTGNYQCSLTSRSISKNSLEQMMVVQVAVNKPILMVSPNKVVVGDEAVLRCESSKGSLPIQYLFYHNETILGNITAHKKEAAELKITIKSLTMDGLYYCASYNDVHIEHQQSEEAKLLIMEPVSDISISTDKEGEAFVVGESLTLTCSVRRGTSISISWQHNNTVVEQNSELYHIQDNGKVLYIDSLQHHHKGTYRCNAKNYLSVNRTLSVLSAIRNVNVMELSADDHTMLWSMLGILLLVIIIVGVLIITCRKKIFAARSCRNKTPSTGMRTKQNNDDVNKQNNKTGQDLVYENTPSRKDLDHEEDGCTYITVKAVKAPSSYVGDVQRDDFTVLYSEVKCSKVTSRTRPDPKTPETSDSTDIYHNISANDINAD